ncbi:hypothetical protein RRG08_052144 [Elysia crispata]|uniref:Uncharacterized protein n=1 Tax=Elysia crispata TaxID=231223 RepID=A0AAE1AHQ5_9GAST|nr:hypothetical protein RRG08_052144 [Elysia crispata]
MAHRKTYSTYDRKPMPMAGYGRGNNFKDPRSSSCRQPYQGRGRGHPSETTHRSTSTADQWAASFREFHRVAARSSVDNDVVEKHIQELESIWLDDGLPDKKQKSLAISERLTEMLRHIPNPWEFILHVVCGVFDYEEAKTSTLAFTILVNFKNWTNSSDNSMKGTAQMESCLSEDLRVQVFNAFSGKHMPFFQIASKAFRLNHEGNEYFLPMIKHRLQQNKIAEVTKTAFNSKIS